MKKTKIKSNQNLFRNTILNSIGLGVRSVFQIGYFIIIARTLGPEEYGAFSATMALISIFIPFSMLGSGNILIKKISRDNKNLNRLWNSAVTTTFVAGVVFTIFLVITRKIFLPLSMDYFSLIFFCLSELIFSRIIDITIQAFQAIDDTPKMVLIQISTSIIKILSSILFLLFFKNHAAQQWSFLFFLSSFITMVISIYLIKNSIKGKFYISYLGIDDLKQGIYFSVGLSASSIYNGIDRTMLSKLLSLEATGIYSAAYKIIDFFLLPLRGLLTSTYTSFFKAGAKGIKAINKIIKKIFPYVIIYSLISILLILFLSRYLPIAFGEYYSKSADILITLSPLIIFRSIHLTIADAITGADYQKQRSLIQTSIAGINFLLNLFFIPRYGILGAVMTSLFCDFLLAITLSIFFVFLNKVEIINEQYIE